MTPGPNRKDRPADLFAAREAFWCRNKLHPRGSGPCPHREPTGQEDGRQGGDPPCPNPPPPVPRQHRAVFAAGERAENGTG